VVPCAVWDEDELMAVRMRGDFGEATELTLSQRIDGREVIRATGEIAGASRGEIIYALPAAWVRQLPVVKVEVLVTTHASDREVELGSYTLLHEGSLQR